MVPKGMHPDRTTRRELQARHAVALAVPGVLALSVPLLGFVASLLLPSVAAGCRALLWPRTRPSTGHVCAGLTLAGLWLPPLLAVVSEGRMGPEAPTWLLLPLCAPSGAALLVPAALAASTYLAGLAESIRARSPWPWALGAGAASLTYWASAKWLVDFSCMA